MEAEAKLGSASIARSVSTKSSQGSRSRLQRMRFSIDFLADFAARRCYDCVGTASMRGTASPNTSIVLYQGSSTIEDAQGGDRKFLAFELSR
jgi:hypothetical protein